MQEGKASAVVIDTSAQIYRFLGSSRMRRSVEKLLGSYSIASCTPFVRKEMRYVLNSVYSHVAGNLRRVEGPLRRRNFTDIWNEAAEIEDPVPGKKKLVSGIAVATAAFFASKHVSPKAAARYIRGSRDVLLRRVDRVLGKELDEYERVMGARILDRSSCCRWFPPDLDTCDGAPDNQCCLVGVFASSRSDFLKCVNAVVDSPLPLDEKAVLTKLNTQLHEIDRGERFVRLVASKPNAFGDLLVYLETPSSDAILAKDRIFFELSKAVHNNEVLYLRPERIVPKSPGESACTVICEGGEEITGTLVNYSPRRDASFIIPRKLPSRSRVSLKCSVLGHKEVPCVIRRVSPGHHEYEYGVRLRYDRIEGE